MKKNLILFFLLMIVCFASCENRTIFGISFSSMELNFVPLYYKYILRDSLKAEAASFLVDNMKYHYSKGKLLSPGRDLLRQRHKTDSVYFSIINGHTLFDFPEEELWISCGKEYPCASADSIPEARCRSDTENDRKLVSVRFLVKHIDHAFEKWTTSQFARDLSFDDFKEYILPYRCVAGYGFLETGAEYDRWFGKYVRSDTASSISNSVEAYNKAVYWMRGMNGNTNRTVKAGLYDMYTHGIHDCVDVASYGCNILRSCGIPTALEYNICYRNLSGRHFHCSVLNSQNDRWEPFSPESALPGDGKWEAAEVMNVYRQMYGAQKNTPYFLKAKNEQIPDILSNPCIKDVTSYMKQTERITLPCRFGEFNNLVYLATFNRESGGLIPVTWGVIDREKQSATFENVLPFIFYIMTGYQNGKLVVLSNPFYVKPSDNSNGGPSVYPIPGTEYGKHKDPTEEKLFRSLVLTRKFPRKPNMIQLAEELTGGRFIGANKADFSDAVTLLDISDPPLPYFLDYTFDRTGEYAYYRFQASNEHPYANISMLEWVTDNSFGYSNSLPASRPHILQPKDTLILSLESCFVKMLDEDSWDKMSWKAEYDGNMQTAPSPYPNITLRLHEPQVVTRVRFSPKNADNGIQCGDTYELLYWDGGWHSAGQTSAQFEFVSFYDVPVGKIYWLRNLSRGKEELPFVMQDGKQQFLYYDILKNENP